MICVGMSFSGDVSLTPQTSEWLDSEMSSGRDSASSVRGAERVDGTDLGTSVWPCFSPDVSGASGTAIAVSDAPVVLLGAAVVASGSAGPVMIVPRLRMLAKWCNILDRRF